jgi:hypothetical protein
MGTGLFWEHGGSCTVSEDTGPLREMQNCIRMGVTSSKYFFRSILRRPYLLRLLFFLGRIFR